MSETSSAATVSVILADYVAADSASKLNMVGGGLTVVMQQPPALLGAPAGATLPFGVFVSVAVPPALYGAQCSLEVQLEDSQGELATMKIGGPDQPAQPLRMGQALTMEEPILPGMNVPRGLLPAKAQWVMMFGAGLPLPAGELYRWRVRIDGDSREDWTAPMYVPLPQVGIVVG